jgi:hypothetical protein
MAGRDLIEIAKGESRPSAGLLDSRQPWEIAATFGTLNRRSGEVLAHRSTADRWSRGTCLSGGPSAFGSDAYLEQGALSK